MTICGCEHGCSWLSHHMWIWSLCLSLSEYLLLSSPLNCKAEWHKSPRSAQHNNILSKQRCNSLYFFTREMNPQWICGCDDKLDQKRDWRWTFYLNIFLLIQSSVIFLFHTIKFAFCIKSCVRCLPKFLCSKQSTHIEWVSLSDRSEAPTAKHMEVVLLQETQAALHCLNWETLDSVV